MASIDPDLAKVAQGQALPSAGADANPDLTACDREPIHVPGAIQPHGILLIADAVTRRIIGGAGDIEGRLTADWLDASLDTLLGQDVSIAVAEADSGIAVPLDPVTGIHGALQAFFAIADDKLLVTLLPAPDRPLSAVAMLAKLDAAGSAFERASDLTALCARAAAAFRDFTGFDRVMIYRFLDDGAGLVLAEERDPALPSFLNHHFPASDIPKQARALYVRNRVRVIPAVSYTPAPIRPASEAMVDLSDVGIRSVSPIHLQYLRNMGVGASASISIVKDGLLWGLVACHHNSPRDIPHANQSACAALAGGLARQIRAKEEAEIYRERIRLRGTEDAILSRIDSDVSVQSFINLLGGDLRKMLGADGFAVVAGKKVATEGVCPPHDGLLELAAWLSSRTLIEPFVSRSLAGQFPAAKAWPEKASGVLAVTVTSDVPMLLMWFRAEERELVEWAGNPHKDSSDPIAELTPRGSFESWSEEVCSRARSWTLPQIESAQRLRRQLVEARQARCLRELNRELTATIADKEALIAQKDHLLGEVNHRVQNSLQLVQAFLGMQERADRDGAAASHLQEAQRRISAVALVHRRLYQADRVETVDLSRYIEELLGDMGAAMGADWSKGLTLDLAPILISADRAVNIGLVLTELVINANKYAYGGGSGPVTVALEEYRNQFRLIVADEGIGAKPASTGARQGFGTRMMTAMVQSLAGTIERFDNKPGLRVIVTAPVAG